MSLMNQINSSSNLLGSSDLKGFIILNQKTWNKLSQDFKKKIIKENFMEHLTGIEYFNIKDQQLFTEILSPDMIDEAIKKRRDPCHTNKTTHYTWITQEILRLITDPKCLLRIYSKIENPEIKKRISQSPNFDSALLILEEIKK